MDWKECNVRKFVKIAERDDSLIFSLVESAESKLKVAKSIPQNEISYSSIIVLAYDSLRTLLEAVASKSGYKIYNHECFTSFLNEILHKNSLAEKFDSVRAVRNRINYYGRKLTMAEFEVLYNDVKNVQTTAFKPWRS
ncbi:MAG: hypothetical protein AABX66_03450 [Nanoarchaeota archaeon]